MAAKSESVTVTVPKWEQYNPRSDVKKPSWFRVEYALIEDPDFYDFTHEEFKAWIYVMAQCCKKNCATIRISYAHAAAVARLSRKGIDSALDKLQQLQLVLVDVTDTSRRRNADVTDTNATGRTLRDVQDITGQNTTDPASRATLDFDALYQKYPRKIGKGEGIKRASELISTPEDYAALSSAIDRYSSHVKKRKTEDRYILHFSTFIEKRESKPYTQPWRDWLDLDAGTSVTSTGDHQRNDDLDAAMGGLFEKGQNHGSR